MRKILTKEFWDTAFRHHDEAAAERTRALFWDAVKIDAEERDAHLNGRAEASISAARLNGCRDESALRAYYRQSLALIQKAIASVHHADDFPDDLMRRVREQVTELGYSFDSHRMCHPTYDGFVCYCDERMRKPAPCAAPSKTSREDMQRTLAAGSIVGHFDPYTPD